MKDILLFIAVAFAAKLLNEEFGNDWVSYIFVVSGLYISALVLREFMRDAKA